MVRLFASRPFHLVFVSAILLPTAAVSGDIAPRVDNPAHCIAAENIAGAVFDQHHDEPDGRKTKIFSDWEIRKLIAANRTWASAARDIEAVTPVLMRSPQGLMDFLRVCMKSAEHETGFPLAAVKAIQSPVITPPAR